MIDQLKEEALRRGDRLSLIAVSRLMDVKEDFDKLGIDTSPYFRFTPPDDLGFPARSVLIAASPSMPVLVSFDLGDRQLQARIPASYADYDRKNADLERYLGALLSAGGFHVRQERSLPAKPLAVHAGLVAYGRNNIVYAGDLGSFINLFVFFSDLPPGEAPFFPLGLLEDCAGCGRCVRNCPTGALNAGQFCVNASRCLTMLNEGPGDFPSWVNPAWHHALIGCEKCQAFCPRSQPCPGPIREIARYSREETEALLRGELSPQALEPLGLEPYHSVLARNLARLIAG
jgi:epoxyqueuosine reductase